MSDDIPDMDPQIRSDLIAALVDDLDDWPLEDLLLFAKALFDEELSRRPDQEIAATAIDHDIQLTDD